MKFMDVTFKLIDDTEVCTLDLTSSPGLDVSFTFDEKYYKVVHIDDDGVCTVKEADPQTGQIT